MKHGTTYGYEKGCRCTHCTEAKRIAHQASRQRLRAANAPSYQRELATARAYKETTRGTCKDCGNPTSWSDSKRPIKRCDPCYRQHTAAQHGTYSKYTAGCRCDPCRTANTERMRQYRAARRVVRTG
jgi:hypothetical protein